jgi:hypothetical protein
MTKLPSLRPLTALALAFPSLCLAVDTGSTAYRNGKTAGFVIAGLIVFLIARQLPGILAWARWLVLAGVAYAVWGIQAPHKPNKLDREVIQAFLDAGVKASAQRDAEALCAQYAEHAEFKMVEVRFSGSDVKTFTKQQMCDVLRQTYSQLPPGAQMSGSMNLQSVEVAGDGQSADISGELVEEMSFGGRSMQSTSQQSATLALMNGQLRYTRVSARVSGGQ